MKLSALVYQGLLAQILLKKDNKALCAEQKKQQQMMNLIRAF